MNKLLNDETPLSTPRPFACSTVEQKSKYDKKINQNSSYNSDDESLGIISIKSDMDDLIENIELKKPSNSSTSYIQQQRELASKTLEKRRESRVSAIPSRYLRPSEISNCSSSYFEQISKGSTVNESDLLQESNQILSTSGNITSTPRCSLTADKNKKVDIAESLLKMSEEIQNPRLSLSAALQKMDEEYQRLQSELNESHTSFLPAGKLQEQLLEDEIKWKNEFDLPVEKNEFSVNQMDNSKMSISAFFKQRSEDISNVIPTFTKKNESDIPNFSFESSSSGNVSVLKENNSTVSNSSPKDSLSVEMIAKLLDDSNATPTKLLDKLLGHTYSPESTKKTENKTSTIDKENFNVPLQNINKNLTKSLASLRSTSSLSNLPGGKLPIVTTHNELTWGCVKPGKSETKKFSIRNKSSEKLRISCTIPGPLFRFESNTSNSLKLTLHANETKGISVIFNPLNNGGVVDEIIFTPSSENLQQTRKQSIKLFGYGGTGIIDFRNVSKDGAGKRWLTLSPDTVCEVEFTILNKGSLAIFANLEYISKKLSFSNIDIQPNFVVIPPNDSKSVRIGYKMTKENFRIYREVDDVFEIGTLKVTTGTEATRGRIRRLSRLATEKNLQVDKIILNLEKEYEGELIPSDVVKCRESINSLNILKNELNQYEIGILLDKDNDTTLVHEVVDETSMFQSLYENSTLRDDDVQSNNCKLQPESIILVDPNKLKDCLFLISNHISELDFTVRVPKNVFVYPENGILPPFGTALIEIGINGSSMKKFNVEVEIGNCVLKSDVNIVSLKKGESPN